ncbi:MAG: GntR family transcriptional regulator [Firmicutes bacterium]|jgi:GntR family transcriptional regulator|nr:GntR family transcriptional regulator [Bacillota bacterium]
MELRFDESIPIYQQILQGVLWDVAVGAVEPGSRLPSVRELSKLTRSNPNTVQRAYMELERMGVVETQRGQGTFVVGDPSIIGEVRTNVTSSAVRSFVEEMRRLKYSDEGIIELVREQLRNTRGLQKENPAQEPCESGTEMVQRTTGELSEVIADGRN